jgi:acetyl-CoA carboxylase carboxyltransferase component
VRRGRKVSKEELGGAQMHSRGSGAVDNEVETEAEAFDSSSDPASRRIQLAMK